MVVRPATVRARVDAIGRDIYGQGSAAREILALAAPVQQGDSGGPFVTGDGLVAGVVFAGDPADGATGYALPPNRSALDSTRPSPLSSRPTSAPAASDPPGRVQSTAVFPRPGATSGWVTPLAVSGRDHRLQ